MSIRGELFQFMAVPAEWWMRFWAFILGIEFEVKAQRDGGESK